MYLVTQDMPTLTEINPHVDNAPHTTLATLAERARSQPTLILAGPTSSDRSAHALAAMIDPTWHAHALGADAGVDDHVLHPLVTATPAGPRGAATKKTPVVVCHGATPLAVKYAVFSLLSDELGVGFRLHGRDAVPRASTQAVVSRLGHVQSRVLSPGQVHRRTSFHTTHPPAPSLIPPANCSCFDFAPHPAFTHLRSHSCIPTSVRETYPRSPCV